MWQLRGEQKRLIGNACTYAHCAPSSFGMDVILILIIIVLKSTAAGRTSVQNQNH